MKIPSEAGTYLLCTTNIDKRTLSIAKVKEDGGVWHIYICERLPDTAAFLRIPDEMVAAVEAESRAKFVALQLEELENKSNWEQFSQLERLKKTNKDLFDQVWAAIPPEKQSFLLKGRTF